MAWIQKKWLLMRKTLGDTQEKKIKKAISARIYEDKRLYESKREKVSVDSSDEMESETEKEEQEKRLEKVESVKRQKRVHKPVPSEAKKKKRAIPTSSSPQPGSRRQKSPTPPVSPCASSPQPGPSRQKSESHPVSTSVHVTDRQPANARKPIIAASTSTENAITSNISSSDHRQGQGPGYKQVPTFGNSARARARFRLRDGKTTTLDTETSLEDKQYEKEAESEEQEREENDVYASASSKFSEPADGGGERGGNGGGNYNNGADGFGDDECSKDNYDDINNANVGAGNKTQSATESDDQSDMEEENGPYTSSAVKAKSTNKSIAEEATTAPPKEATSSGTDPDVRQLCDDGKRRHRTVGGGGHKVQPRKELSPYLTTVSRIAFGPLRKSASSSQPTSAPSKGNGDTTEEGSENNETVGDGGRPSDECEEMGGGVRPAKVVEESGLLGGQAGRWKWSDTIEELEREENDLYASAKQMAPKRHGQNVAPTSQQPNKSQTNGSRGRDIPNNENEDIPSSQLRSLLNNFPRPTTFDYHTWPKNDKLPLPKTLIHHSSPSDSEGSIRANDRDPPSSAVLPPGELEDENQGNGNPAPEKESSYDSCPFVPLGNTPDTGCPVVRRSTSHSEITTVTRKVPKKDVQHTPLRMCLRSRQATGKEQGPPKKVQ